MLNVKALVVRALNQEVALAGALSVIVKTLACSSNVLFSTLLTWAGCGRSGADKHNQ